MPFKNLCPYRWYPMGSFLCSTAKGHPQAGLAKGCDPGVQQNLCPTRILSLWAGPMERPSCSVTHVTDMREIYPLQEGPLLCFEKPRGSLAGLTCSAQNAKPEGECLHLVGRPAAGSLWVIHRKGEGGAREAGLWGWGEG